MDTEQIHTSRSRIIVVSLLIIGIILLIVLLSMFWGDADEDGNNTDSFFGILFNDKRTSTDNDPLRGGVIIGDDTTGEEEKITLYLISQGPVVGASLSSDGTRVRYFKQAGGNLFEAEFTGENETRISNVTIPAILDVAWTPSKTYAIISFYADGEMRRLYSRYTGTSTISSAFLPSGIQEITTSLVDDMIAYTVVTSGETVLFTARPDNTNVKKVLALPAPDFELVWPTANTIVLKQNEKDRVCFFILLLSKKTQLLICHLPHFLKNARGRPHQITRSFAPFPSLCQRAPIFPMSGGKGLCPSMTACGASIQQPGSVNSFCHLKILMQLICFSLKTSLSYS